MKYAHLHALVKVVEKFFDVYHGISVLGFGAWECLLLGDGRQVALGVFVVGGIGVDGYGVGLFVADDVTLLIEETLCLGAAVLKVLCGVDVGFALRCGLTAPAQV